MRANQATHTHSLSVSMASAKRNAATVRSGNLSVKRVLLLCFVAFCMIASDCMSLLGQRAYSLKYVGLIALIFFSFIGCAHVRLRRARVICMVSAVCILLIETFFQGSVGMTAQAIMLYMGVLIVGCCAASVLRTRRELLALGLFCTILVLVLLYLSRRDVVAQWNFYTAVGRPRFKGCFTNPNSFGAISVLSLIMLICGEAGASPERFLRGAGIVTMSLLTILSGSRTSILMAVGFVVALYYLRFLGRVSSMRAKILITMVAMVVLVVSFIVLSRGLEDDVPVMLRVRTLQNIRIGGLRSWVGIGYVGSSDADLLTSAAGGTVEILLVSLYYRVGIIGIIAYCILMRGAAFGRVDCDHAIVGAFYIAVLLQAVGESFLSSIMSFPSCFIWVLFSALPMMTVRRESPESVEMIGTAS